MPGSPQDTSFIPKNNPNRRKRTVRQGNIYILTIISYLVFFSTLIAAAAVFFYDRYVQGQLEQEVVAMNSEVGSFQEADMVRVLDFDQRLRKAFNRVENSVSVASIFNALEVATVNTVRFDSFQLTRNLDEGFTIQAAIQTTSFDSSMFQRDIFSNNEVIEVVEIQDLVISDESTDGGNVFKSVTFTAQLGIPLAAVPYSPDGNETPSPIAPTAALVPASTTPSSDEEDDVATSSAAVPDPVTLVEASSEIIRNEPAL